MAAGHGTHSRYVQGCRCESCSSANKSYLQEYRSRRMAGEVGADPVVDPSVIGAVESAVRLELVDVVQTGSRPALVATAVALARVLDNPRAMSVQPAAARQLKAILEDLRNGSDVRGRSRLSVVRALTGDTT